MNITGDAKTIAAAFIRARGEMGALVSKDAKGNFGRYVTLAAIVEATTLAFANHGLVIVQEAGTNEEGVSIDTWLIHESGATMQFGSLTMPLGDRKPQTVGSGITYGRRYALAAVCGLAGEDDDGQAAQDSVSRGYSAKEATPQRNGVNKASLAPKSPPGTAAESDPDLWQTEEPKKSDLLSQAQLIRIHTLGSQLYGAAWDAQRPKLVQAVTKGAVSSAKELSPDEAETLIVGMQKKLDQRIAEAAKEQAPV